MFAEAKEELGKAVIDFLMGAVVLVVGEGEGEEGSKVTPSHDVQESIVLLLDFYPLDALKVAVVLRLVLDEVLAAEGCQEGVIVLLFSLDGV